MSHTESFLEAMSTNGEVKGVIVVELKHFRGQQEGLGNKTHQQENCGIT